jgi:hypothetical protein
MGTQHFERGLVRKIKANVVCCKCLRLLMVRSILMKNNLPILVVHQNINLERTRQVQITYSPS